MSVKVGLIQMSMLDDRALSLRKAERLIDDAAKKGAQIVCLLNFSIPYTFRKSSDPESIAETIPGETTSILSRRSQTKQDRLDWGFNL